VLYTLLFSRAAHHNRKQTKTQGPEGTIRQGLQRKQGYNETPVRNFLCRNFSFLCLMGVADEIGSMDRRLFFGLAQTRRDGIKPARHPCFIVDRLFFEAQ